MSCMLGGSIEWVSVSIATCRLMRRRIKVADPRIFLIYAAYMNIHEEVVDEYHYTFAASYASDTADQ